MYSGSDIIVLFKYKKINHDLVDIFEVFYNVAPPLFGFVLLAFTISLGNTPLSIKPHVYVTNLIRDNFTG